MQFTRREMISAAILSAGAWVSQGAAGAAKTAASLAYDGPGIYLYPNWGEPRPYLVMPVHGSEQAVEFRDPASKALLWSQSLSICGEFAGKLS